MIESVYKAYNRSMRWWRQYLYWGLVFNTFVGFWVIIAFAQFGKPDMMASLLTLYGSNLTATLGAAGLRHMDKKLDLQKMPGKPEGELQSAGQ